MREPNLHIKSSTSTTTQFHSRSRNCHKIEITCVKGHKLSIVSVIVRTSLNLTLTSVRVLHFVLHCASSFKHTNVVQAQQTVIQIYEICVHVNKPYGLNFVTISQNAVRLCWPQYQVKQSLTHRNTKPVYNSFKCSAIRIQSVSTSISLNLKTLCNNLAGTMWCLHQQPRFDIDIYSLMCKVFW